MLLCITWPSKLKYWSSCLVVPQYNNIAGQQGMRAGQILLDWLMPAERNWLTSCAVALCREVQCVRTVDRKHTQWKNYELQDQINCMVLSLPYSPWPLKDTYHSHLGWGGDFFFGGGYPDGSSSLHARFSSMTFERYSTYHYHLGWVGSWGGILMVPHQDMPDSSP